MFYQGINFSSPVSCCVGVQLNSKILDIRDLIKVKKKPFKTFDFTSLGRKKLYFSFLYEAGIFFCVPI